LANIAAQKAAVDTSFKTLGIEPQRLDVTVTANVCLQPVWRAGSSSASSLYLQIPQVAPIVPNCISHNNPLCTFDSRYQFTMSFWEQYVFFNMGP
jgi:hypothetical protein